MTPSYLLRSSLLLVFFAFCLLPLQAQDQFQYEPSEDHPFGLLHPDAPPQLADFAPMIGRCQCTSVNRNADGTWQEPVAMDWEFKYIMNGMAIQDQSWKANGVHSGSIRQFNVDSLMWYVTYYTTANASPGLSTWEGKKEGNDIVLYLPQQAPNGMDGFSRLTFFNISKKGFQWKGEWVDTDETITYPFWTIDCKKEGTINFRPD